MIVLTNNPYSILMKSLKNSSLILLASMLFACSAETESSGSYSPTKKVEEVVETTVETTKETVSDTVKEAQNAVVDTPATTEAPSTPKPPADYSTLNPSTYKPVADPFPTSTAEQVEVVELFWFGCGHCFALEPHLKSWLKNKPANAKFKKVPAIFSSRWEFHGKAFYTMEALNVPEQAYDDFFRRIHVTKIGINNIDDLSKFLAKFDKDKELVENTFNSFAVDSQFRNAIKITKASGARGVPAMVVDGQYLTSQSDAGGTPEMFDVVDKLVAKVAAEK